jgi:ADP-ribose pyrophosphatase YjhB (NUDIX family)
MACNELISIRGLYWAEKRGLLLLRTQHSEVSWTTPGGKTPYCEGHMKFMERRLMRELGLRLINMTPEPIIAPFNFAEPAPRAPSSNIIVYAYGVDLAIQPGQILNGHCLGYDFFNLERLSRELEQLTPTTRLIVQNPAFLERAVAGSMV